MWSRELRAPGRATKSSWHVWVSGKYYKWACDNNEEVFGKISHNYIKYLADKNKANPYSKKNEEFYNKGIWA